jgi:TPR repeat protein
VRPWRRRLLKAHNPFGNQKSLTALQLWPVLKGCQRMVSAQEASSAQSDKQKTEASLASLQTLANQGDAQAQYNLGIMYQYGRGVPQDFILAHRWFNLAGANSMPFDNWRSISSKAMPLRDKAAQARDNVASKMTPAQIAEAQRQASAWRKSE